MTITSFARTTLCVVSMLAGATAAMAQSGETPGWSGGYVGAHVGYVILDIDAKYTGPAVGADLPFDMNEGAVGVGAFAGYNFRSGNIVFGPEVDFGWMPDEGTRARPGGAAGFDPVVSTHIRGRAGVLMQDDLLLYGGLGLAITGLETSRVPAALFPRNQDFTTIFGLSVGVGAEYAVTEDIHMRVDYIYDHYFEQSVTKTEPIGGILFPKTQVEIGSHAIRIGASIAFD